MRKEERAQKETYAVLPERNNEIGTNIYNKVVAVIVVTLSLVSSTRPAARSISIWRGERERELDVVYIKSAESDGSAEKLEGLQLFSIEFYFAPDETLDKSPIPYSAV